MNERIQNLAEQAGLEDEIRDGKSKYYEGIE